MDKQKEIQVLQSLKGDTYFAQFFGDKDINQMCQNISNDFAIESGCHFMEKVGLLKDAVKKAKERVLEVYEKIIETDTMSDEIYEIIEKEAGKKFIIMMKYKYDILLEDDEIDFLVKNLNAKED